MALKKLASILSFTGTLALAYVCSSADASTITTELTKPESLAAHAIEQGRWKIGGSASYFKYEDISGAGISPSVEYFALDRFTLGLATGLYWNNGESVGRSIKPSASYYLFTHDNFAGFIKQSVEWNWIGGSSNSRTVVTGESRVGLDWFLNKYVALTPSIGVAYGKDRKMSTLGTIGLSVFF